MKIMSAPIVRRWNSVMNSCGLEHITIGESLSELETQKDYFGIEEGVSVGWMREEAQYWLSCYYEKGNCRCDDRKDGKEEYAIWVSETGKLKRLIARLQNMDSEMLIVEWE